MEGSDKFNLQILDVVEREPKTPTSVEKDLSPTSEWEEALPSEKLSLVPIRRPPPPWIHPFMGRWVQPTSPWGNWPDYDPTPRIPTGSYLIWIHGVDSLPLHNCGGGAIPMSNLDHCTNYLTTDPVWIPGPIWLLSTYGELLGKCNALYLTQEWLYCSQTPMKWPEMCLFMSVTSANKHDKNSLIIEQTYVTQHPHIHLFSHWDHSVFAVLSLISTGGLDTSLWTSSGGPDASLSTSYGELDKSSIW